MPGPDPTYMDIKGEWISPELPYYVVHRIAAVPRVHGIFASIMNYCEQTTCNLRIDTHKDNHAMIHLLRKAGFSFCGYIRVENGTERLAFQRIRV